MTLSSLKHLFFTVCYDRIVFPGWISCAKISEFEGTLPLRFIHFRHSGVKYIKSSSGSRWGECSYLPPTEEKLLKTCHSLWLQTDLLQRSWPSCGLYQKGHPKTVKKFVGAKMESEISLDLRRQVCCPVEMETRRLI